MRRAQVVAAYGTAALALAGQWIAAKIALAEAPPLELSTVRFAICAAVLLPICAATRTPLPLRSWRAVAAAAAFGFLGFNGLAFLGLQLTPASDSALIVPTTIPVATALIATRIGERLTRRRALGFGVASVGTVLVIVGGQGTATGVSLERLVGDLLELASAVSWAACLAVTAVVLRRERVLGFLALASVFGTLMLLPLGFLESGYRDLAGWGTSTWLSALYLGVVATALAIYLFFWAVGRFGAGLAAMISYLAPVATLILAWIILGERPVALQLLGGAVILLGVRLTARRGGGRPRARLGTAASPS